MHLLVPRVFIGLLLIGVSLGVPNTGGGCPVACSAPVKRRAWHTLSTSEKKEYIDAELCLMKKPATLGLRGTRTKFDELQSLHVLQTEITHWVGAFLPFHRLFMWAHEHQLRTECGYKGGQPYWEEQLDAGNFMASPVLDPITGFGGNGTEPNGCIVDGPFAWYMNAIGPGYKLNDHCIDRKVNESMSLASYKQTVDRCLDMPNFLELWACVEGDPHGGGHIGVGGQMRNPISSPGDPVFYLHHTFLDKIWWDWQQRDLPSRLKDMGGRNKVPPPPTTSVEPPKPTSNFPQSPGRITEPRPADVPEPQVVGDPGNETTLDHVIEMYGVVKNRVIGEIMDTRGFLCYEYA